MTGTHTGTGTTEVLFVLLPESLLLDWAGPAEALRIANQARLAQGQEAPFRLRFVGPQPEARSSVGATIAAIAPLPQALPARCWVVLPGMPGRQRAVAGPAVREAVDWLRGQRAAFATVEGDRRLVTVCAGTLLAARAGLLRGRQATTHHQHLEDL